MPLRTILLLSIAAFALPAQPQLPDTPAARQFSAWLKAFNGGNEAELRLFYEKNFPSRLQRLRGEMSFRAMTGGFDVRKIEESTPAKLTVLVQERDSDQFGRAVIEVQPTEPFGIVSLDLNAIPRPAEFAIAPMTETELIRALGERLIKDTAADQFSGAVLVAKNGKPIFAKASGLADREKNISNTLDTRFRIGSMNKMFTAVCILQLAQSGKIDLHQPLGKYVPDYPNQEVASKVTIHNLLTHTGGTGDIFGPEFEAHRSELRTLDDYVKLYGKRGLEFEPGSRWSYSNYGFILLGVVIEKVSGESYYEYVRKHVYEPAGMTSTGSLPETENVAGRSVGYTKFGSEENWRPNTDTLPYRGTSAGGGYSTVPDLLRFSQALLDHKLLDARYTDLLTTGKVDARGAKYAYGFEDQNLNGVRYFGHGGGAPGMNGDLEIFPETGYVVAVLANMDPPSATRLSQLICNRLPR